MSHPKKPTDMGTNRTGIATAKLRAGESVEGAEEGSPGAGTYGAEIARFRADLSQGAPPIGSVPPPGTVKGAMKTAMQALQGHKANVFLDKLAERLAFERTGVRLYDALLSKVPAAKKGEGTLTAEALRQIREDELRHMHVVREAIEQLGGDPTAMTPCADLVGVQGAGLVQAISDPRTTLTQGLDTILAAELVDNDGWKMLIAMAEGLGQTDLAKRFTIALVQEDQHLADVRRWLSERLEIQLGASLPSAEFGDPVQPA